MHIGHFARLALIALPVMLSACVTTETQADGSTRVKVSVADALGIKPATKPAPTVQASSASAPAAAAPSAPPLSASALGGLFTKHPYDGTAKSEFPRVAVTIIDWSRSDCWNARAKIWWSNTKSENVAPFSVCFGNQSFGFALNQAANIHIFFGQTAVEHTGNVRSEGPKAPMIALPDGHPSGVNSQSTFVPFVQQMIVETGWKGGAFTNFWIVDYNNKAVAEPAVRAPAAAPALKDAKHVAVLQQALQCKSPNGLDKAMKALKIPTDGSRVLAPAGLKVFGQPVTHVEFALEGGEGIHKSAFGPATTMEQIRKAAVLKADKNGTPSRSVKIQKDLWGYFSAEKVEGMVVLTCSIDYEQNQE